MANAYTIDKLDPKTKKALVKDILSGQSANIIANNYGIPVSCVRRYKNDKLIQAVAEVWAETKQEVAEGYEEKLRKFETVANKIIVATEKALDEDGTGEYDLTDPKKAYLYVKMLNETLRTLQPIVKEIAQIQGDIKETVAIQNNPTLILAQIGQIVEQTPLSDKGELIARLKQLRTEQQ